MSLRVELDLPLPGRLAVGAGTAVFVSGWCHVPGRRVRDLTLLVDGVPQPLAAHAMPRLDVLRELHPETDPYDVTDGRLAAYRSGFWGTARIGPGADGTTCHVGLRATLADGTVHTAALAAVVRTSLPSGPPRGRELAICMATHEPPRALFARQVASLRAQDHDDWVCVISDDASSPGGMRVIEDVIAGDERFVVDRSPRRLGFYRNFERALALAPLDARYVALADQDDDWHPDKLSTLVAALGDAQLVYSDARIVGPAGEVRADTYWSTRRNNHSDLLSLLVANAVTGAASLVRRDLLEDALPFPPAQFAHFHDHWIGLVALARGDIAYVDRPLYDYVQHGAATLGHEAANRMPALADRVRNLRTDPHEKVRMWRLHYFADVCRLVQVASVLDQRVGPRMSRAKRRTLTRFLKTDRSVLAVAHLGLRGARELLARDRPETLGAEWMLAHAFAWRRLLSATTRDRPARRIRLDAVPPASFVQAPGRTQPAQPAVRVVAEKLAPLTFHPADDAPPRVNILIPTVDLKHFFGGYIGKFNLAARLADRGHRVRLITVDPTGVLPDDWRRTVESYSGLDGFFDRVELAFGRESAGIEVGGRDAVVATTWWTAHHARDAIRATGSERFTYLIQEYEPFTFPMGTWAALAAESYDLPHRAIFSTELLREYFRRHRIGVYGRGPKTGDAASVSFQNAITDVRPPSAAELDARPTRRLLFYARPEPHAARNLFELGMLALRRAVEDGTLRGWDLRGIGTVELGRRADLGGGAALELIPRAQQGDYARMLAGHDVGLALMYTPHPSLVPLEMAAAGLVTVTNTFEHKTADALSAIAPNLLAAAPTVDGIAAAIGRAVAAAGDGARRVAGAEVAWSRDWRTSFDDALLDRIGELLR